ncbi:MAG: ribonuclease Z [Bacteroidia bacterium]|nr:ribonuclease Z [Bacteroidia bacterium]
MFKVKILGSSSATPAFSRNPSAQVVTYNDRHYLVDCGEGTQIQFQRYNVKLARLDGIFISHLHGDHVLGLPGLLSSLSIFEREKPLPVYAPGGLVEMLKTFFRISETYLKYEVEFFPMEDFQPGDIVFSTDKLRVKALPLTHRAFCRGFLFEEYNKRRKFDFFKAKALEIPNEYFHLLKQENDITLPDGRRIQADEVLMDADAPLSFAYCSDTRYEEKLLPFIQNVSMLYHEATFMEDMQKRARETQHSTAREAASIALQAGAKRLIIGHFSARYRDLNPLLEEARAVFPDTELATEGTEFDLRANV